HAEDLSIREGRLCRHSQLWGFRPFSRILRSVLIKRRITLAKQLAQSERANINIQPRSRCQLRLGERTKPKKETRSEPLRYDQIRGRGAGKKRTRRIDEKPMARGERREKKGNGYE